MATFFDVDNPDDIALLHASVRTDSELSNMVDKVEWELLDAYKQRDLQGLDTYDSFFRYEFGNSPDSTIKVRLVGYDAQTPADSEAGLKEALKRTIADIVSWSLRDYYAAQGVTSQTQGNRSITYSGGMAMTWRDWPRGWNNKLNNYDARFQQYGI